MLLGAVLVYFKFPKMEREKRLLAEYHAQDVGEAIVEPALPQAGNPAPA